MKINYHSRLMIVIVLTFLTVLIWNLIAFTGEIIAIYGISSDEVSENDQRFEKIKSVLPQHGIVGFITESYIVDGEIEIKPYYLAQYALSPTKVVRGLEAELIVADFGSYSKYEQYLLDQSLILIHDFGENVLLLRYLGK